MEEEEREENEKKRNVFKSLSENTNVETMKLPFAKLNLQQTTHVKNNKNNTNNEKIEIVEKRINKFIYLGKINNFSIIKKKEVKKTETVLFKNVNYSEYKKQLLQKKQ